MTPPRGIAIIASMRTGSNYVEEALASLPGTRALGEVFNPVFVGAPDAPSLPDLTPGDRDAGPLDVLDRLLAGQRPILRIFDGHNDQVVHRVLHSPAWQVIHLTRDPLASFVSLQIARATDQWRLQDASQRRTTRVWFDPQEFAVYARRIARFTGWVDATAQEAGQPVFPLRFNALRSRSEWDRLTAWLGLPGHAQPRPRLLRQNPGPLAAHVLNPGDLPGAPQAERVTLAAAMTPLALRAEPHPAIAAWLHALDDAPPRVVTSNPNVKAVDVALPALVRAQCLWGADADRAEFIARIRAAKRYGLVPDCPTPTGAVPLSQLPALARAAGHPSPPEVPLASPALDTPRIRRLVGTLWPPQQETAGASSASTVPDLLKAAVP